MKNTRLTSAEKAHLPEHIAIIMDGNGRWAEHHGLPRFKGRIAGLDRARSIIRYLDSQYHTKYLTLFGFSTENWNRPPDEVGSILRIFAEIIDQEAQAFHERGIRLRHLGRLEELPEGLRDSLVKAMELTKLNTGMTFCLAFNYGGRAEIVDAVRHIAAAGIPPDEIDEDLIGKHLYATDIPNVDLLIRTGGELRFSNFLIWQSIYSEHYFSDVFWPDFSEAEMDKALKSYIQRQRRFGQIP